MKKNILPLAVMIAFASCQQKNKTQPVETPVVKMDTTKKSEKFTVEMVDNKKDFVCGMPVRAGISDTVHYKGKVYGFCSAGCKEDFLKDPQSWLTKK